MLTTNKSWQVMANTANLPKVNATDANLTGSKQNTSSSNQVDAYMMKIVTPKRYSFDDNGGGYQGL
jgi:hypothetical protein